MVAERVRPDLQFWVIGPKGPTLPLNGWLELLFLHRMAMNHSRRVTGKDHYMQGELQLVLEKWQLLDASRDTFSRSRMLPARDVRPEDAGKRMMKKKMEKEEARPVLLHLGMAIQPSTTTTSRRSCG